MSEVTGRKRRPYAPRVSPEERRDQILDAALVVIVESGIHKVSIDSVAKVAGITRPVVYGQFADTNELLRASLAREEERVMAQVLPIAEAADERGLVDGLLFYLEGFLDAVGQAPNRWRAVFMLVDSSTPAYRKRLEAGRAVVIHALEQRLMRARGSELPADIDVELLARAIFAVLWDSGRGLLERPDQFTKERIMAFARSAFPGWTSTPSRT